MLGTLHEAPDGRFAIRLGRQIPQPPEHIWPYITDPAKLPAWLYPAQVDLTGPAGTELVFTNVFPERDPAAPVAAGWHAALDVLETRLDDRDIDWDPWKRAEALTAADDEAFATNEVAPANCSVVGALRCE